MVDYAANSQDAWRRHVLGGSSLVLLAVGIVFLIWPPGQASAQFLQGSCIKSGVVLGAAWLAFPHMSRLPGWMFVSVVGGLLLVAVRPRVMLALSRYVVMIMPILFGIWLLRRLGGLRK